MLSQIFKQKFSISKIIVPGNGAKNLIARKYTGVVVHIKVVPQRLVIWIIEFSLLKFAK